MFEEKILNRTVHGVRLKLSHLRKKVTSGWDVEKDTEDGYSYPHMRTSYVLNSWSGRNSKIRYEVGLYILQLVEGIRINSLSAAKRNKNGGFFKEI